jgi:aminoglycoside phosphotransferase (APT) family kinase protein
MRREHTILSAVGPAGVPVPKTLGLCEDISANGAPFYVMAFSDGIITRNEEEVEALLTPAARFRSGEALVDTLAQIHAVDPDAAGLGSLGRKEGYIPRQLRRWYGQYRTSRDEMGGPDVADVDEVHDLLAERVPDQGPATIVHGDYRLDNCILDPTGQVLAVLDWELCTLGDPLADVGQLLTYWPEPGERSPLEHSPTRAPGFPTRDQLAARYEEASGRDLSQIDFYRAFSSWRVACILEGVYTRYIGGAMGDQDVGVVKEYPSTIVWLAAQAKETLGTVR